MKDFSLLAVPAWEKGRGGGHLSRSLELVRSIRRAGARAWLYLPPQCPAGQFPGVEEFLIAEAELSKRRFSLIVLDRFKTSAGEFARWSSLGPVAAIDEGGRREAADFLIDILPGPPGKHPPNLNAPWLLPLPKRRRPSFTGPARGEAGGSPKMRALVSFGAEDKAGLTIPAALAASDAMEITAFFGPLNKTEPSERARLEIAGIRVLTSPDPASGNGDGGAEFRETLPDYDLVITHFGLTAFEALRGNVPVLLVSPGVYHEKLTRYGGFVSAGIGKRGIARLPALLSSPAGGLDPKKYRKIAECSKKTADLASDAESLGEFFLSWTPMVHRGCPVCASPAGGKVLARFPGRTYRRCSCGMAYLDRWDSPSQKYTESYFFAEYKRQYGRTYLEDFSRLKNTGEGRLRRIRKFLVPGVRPKLLDIGCAYGPFLEAARDRGFEPLGIDPAGEAVDYVKKDLHIPAVRGFFPEDFSPGHNAGSGGLLKPGTPAELFPPESFDVISLWYVIEHFREPRPALEALKRLLKPGGVLAFSTPSYNGISRRKSFKAFLEQSPGDHWTIWDPRRCAGILKKFGFRVKKRVITGHHPERFPLIGRLLKADTVLYGFFSMVSRLFGLGDTFEVYAVKELSHG